MPPNKKQFERSHRAKVYAKRNPRLRRGNEAVGIRELNQAGDNYHRTAEIISSIEKYGALHKLEAGNACLELAIANPAGLDDDGRLEWLNRAQKNWELAVKARGDRVEPDSGMALMQIAQLPTYSWLTLENRLPPLEATDKVYGSLIEVARAHHEAYLQKQDTADNFGLHELAGNIAELNVLLLLDRFVLRELQSEDWLALPALRSQDVISKSRGSALKDNWDISVLTSPQAEATPELSYKIQVKSTARAAGYKNYEYSDEVTMVTVASDLALGRNPCLPILIMQDLIEESDGSTSKGISADLDRRTEKLLALMN